MNTITPHEPDEPLVTVDDVFRDAAASEARWREFDAAQGLKRIAIDLPTPLYNRLEEIARKQNSSVPTLLEHVIEELAVTFGVP